MSNVIEYVCPECGICQYIVLEVGKKYYCKKCTACKKVLEITLSIEEVLKEED